MVRLFVLKNNIRFYRKRLGLTQAQLACKVGVSKTALFYFERGDYSPTAKVALMLCICLGCSFEDLFYLA